jgi:WD40 repeat protein
MGHSDVITCLYYSDKVISGYCTFRSQDGTIRIWVQGLDPVILPHTAFDSTLAPVVSFDVSKNGLIASIAYDEKIRIWDNAILSKCWASPTTKSIVWSPDGNILMCINSDSLTIWDQSTAKVLEIPQKIERKSEFILSAQWRNNQEFSLVSNSDVWLWGLDTDPKLILNQTAACAKWNCNGSILGMVCGGRLGVYKDSGDIWWISGNVSQFDFTPLDDTVVTGGHAGEIQFWDLNKKTILKSFQGHQGKILNILHRHDGEFLATSALDGILHIWKTEDYLKTKSINIENIQDM